MPGIEDVVSLLHQSFIFAGLPVQHLQEIAQVMRRIQFDQGQTLFEEGDPGDALYLLEQGRVSVLVKNAQLGMDLEVDRLALGEVFGEMALLTDNPRSATVKALETTTCLVLPKRAFAAVCERYPQVTMALVQTLARRLWETNKECGIAFARLSHLPVDPAASRLLPADLLSRHKVVPVSFDDSTLVLAMVNPGNALAFDEVRRLYRGIQIKPVAITEEDFQRWAERTLRPAPPEAQAAAGARGEKAGAAWRELQVFSDAEDAAEEKRAAAALAGQETVALLNQIVAEGIDRGASDIHVDCERLLVMVRYRVDGQLVAREAPVARAHLRPLVSRVKILAGMDITEKRVPQDGRFSLSYRGRDWDVRVASMPVRGGERVALRLLDPASGLLDLGAVILADKLVQVVRRMAFRPNGIVFITGPTGSGKTTTLYALLRERTRGGGDLNVVTVEDPIEYDLPGIAQVEVNEAAGLTFPRVLRGFLRHDPDVILVGETRDNLTAHICMEAALTGHLVLSSMHTNGAIESIARLREMEVEPYMIASALSGVISQRLVRRLCPTCAGTERYADTIASSLRRVGALGEGDGAELPREKGCAGCGGTGFRGRVGVFEVLPVQETLRQLISDGASEQELRREALGRGMVTLGRYANFLLRSRLTVPSEVLRVLSPDEG